MKVERNEATSSIGHFATISYQFGSIADQYGRIQQFEKVIILKEVKMLNLQYNVKFFEIYLHLQSFVYSP